MVNLHLCSCLTYKLKTDYGMLKSASFFPNDAAFYIT